MMPGTSSRPVSAPRGGERTCRRKLELEWARRLKAGSEIDVHVIDIYRPGEDRPFAREVFWKETSPEGIRTSDQRCFANTFSPTSREARGIKLEGLGNGRLGEFFQADFPGRTWTREHSDVIRHGRPAQTLGRRHLGR